MTELLDRLKDKALLKTQSFINGAWVEGKPWIEVTSPSNRSVLAQMSDVGAKGAEDAIDAEGWFNTGDVAILHPDGTMQITDRTKDVIKSGGEWISSVELENAAVGHPAVAEAAAIGMMHPKWDERPVLFVVKQAGKEVTAEEVINFLSDKVAKWWLPDAVEFVDDIPHTATGKISKKDLRDRFSDYQLEI